MFDIKAIQQALKGFGLDGWLLYDFRGSNVLARRVLGIDPNVTVTRRFAYAIPAAGEPMKLVHRIESGVLDHLPGSKTVYLTWQEFEAGMKTLAGAFKTVAMEYSPRNANPYVSRVDAGTVELVRSFGVEITGSGDLIQSFEAAWDDQQWQMHLEAARHTDSAYAAAWQYIAGAVRRRETIDERAVLDVILKHFKTHALVTDHPPIVAVDSHSGNPHYETGTGDNTTIGSGAFVLIDLWGKLDRQRAVYSDLTRVGYVGEEVPARYAEIFQIVAAARDRAIACVRDAFAQGKTLLGWEVDRAARGVIEQAGYGAQFVHRTGHSIGQETHGNGANMDDLETHEERRVIRRTCFSVEPGIYLPEFGIRSEVNVFVDAGGQVHVTGGRPQEAVVAILKA